MRLFRHHNSSISWPLCDHDEPSDAGNLVLDLGPSHNSARYEFLIAAFSICLIRVCFKKTET